MRPVKAPLPKIIFHLLSMAYCILKFSIRIKLPMVLTSISMPLHNVHRLYYVQSDWPNGSGKTFEEQEVLIPILYPPLMMCRTLERSGIVTRNQRY